LYVTTSKIQLMFVQNFTYSTKLLNEIYLSDHTTRHSLQDLYPIIAIVLNYQCDREGLGAEMEREIPMGKNPSKQPLEIDIRKILVQLGIQMEKWPEEYMKSVQKT
jgi:hypothetical protein